MVAVYWQVYAYLYLYACVWEGGRGGVKGWIDGEYLISNCKYVFPQSLQFFLDITPKDYLY